MVYPWNLLNLRFSRSMQNVQRASVVETTTAHMHMLSRSKLAIYISLMGDFAGKPLAADVVVVVVV